MATEELRACPLQTALSQANERGVALPVMGYCLGDGCQWWVKTKGYAKPGEDEKWVGDCALAWIAECLMDR